jgi:uncharacterized membrane protein (UPF0127 family)
MKAIVAGLALWMLAAQAAELPTVKLDVDGRAVTAEVAATPEQRATGLMNRFSLAPDHGMVFVFPQPQPLSFWMRNTYIPLSIAYIAVDGRILNIEDMAPLTENSHWSKGLALYALEMKQGWFQKNGVGPGALVKGLPKPSAN